MEQLLYYPAGGVLAVIDQDGWLVRSYAGPIAVRKLEEALCTGVDIRIVDGSCVMKPKPVDAMKLIGEQFAAASRTVVIRRKEAYND